MSISCMSASVVPDLSPNIAQAAGRKPRVGARRRSRIRPSAAGVGPLMRGPWLQDLESLEAISQDADARRIFLRMAAMSHAGRMPSFLAQVAGDSDLDDDTKGHLAELAQDESFLCAVEEYLQRTRRIH